MVWKSELVLESKMMSDIWPRTVIPTRMQALCQTWRVRVGRELFSQSFPAEEQRETAKEDNTPRGDQVAIKGRRGQHICREGE